MVNVEVNVAIVALIISLVALVVTTNQLLVQIFNSANGYRQCAVSVIGSWHTRRKRVWKWSEFRFETQYVTPQIVILTPQELNDYRDEYDEVYLINSPNLKDVGCKELDHTVHQMHWQLHSQKLERTLTRTMSEMEKGATNSRNKAKPRRITSVQNDPLVTWLRLLRELHLLARSYWPKDCPTCAQMADEQLDATWTETETGLDSSRCCQSARPQNRSRTDIGVVYRTWNWDFMPPDLTRPLAEVNVADILVLALRMGMQWRALDLDSGRMQADGNGFNLTGLEVRGLGIVLRLTATGQHEGYPRLIPSRAVDKMLFGILPGDPELVGQDFGLILKDGSVRSLTDPRGILATIGMSKGEREELSAMELSYVRFDVMTLLLPFLPLDGCTMTKYCFPWLNIEPSFHSAYYFWEGRFATERLLRERIRGDSISAKLREDLSQVLEKMDYLQEQYPHDWYMRWDRQPKIRGDDVETKKKCMEDAREVFDWTQSWFKNHQFGRSSRSQSRHSKYAHLVAAYASMAAHACLEAEEFCRHQYYSGQDDVCIAYDIDRKRHGVWFVYEAYEVAIHHVKYIHHERHGIGAYFKSINIDIPDDEAEAAWWVMQLRGSVWHFSTWFSLTMVNEILGDQLIPSSFMAIRVQYGLLDYRMSLCRERQPSGGIDRMRCHSPSTCWLFAFFCCLRCLHYCINVAMPFVIVYTPFFLTTYNNLFSTAAISPTVKNYCSPRVSKATLRAADSRLGPLSWSGSTRLNSCVSIVETNIPS